jgi:DNA-directed RNA polymerase I, II, and III subunit RPABC2
MEGLDAQMDDAAGQEAKSGEQSQILGIDELNTDSQKKERVTTKYMTKYERARVLGTRALQLRYRSC